MARLTIALVLALLAVYVVAETTYNIQLDGYQGTECAGTAIATTTYTNGSCGVFIGQYSSNVSCSATGASSGYLCISTTCGGDSCTFIDGSQRGFGEQLCQATGQQASVGFTCLETVVPEAPAAPAAEPTEVPEAPTAPTAPVAPAAPTTTPTATPTMPTTPPADGALITSGNVTASFWTAPNCPNSAFLTIPLFANYSKCQAYTYSGNTFYFRADCYITEYSKVSTCTDNTCSSCTDLQSTQSGTCFAAELSILRSAKIVCPTYHAPSVPTPSSATSVLASFAFVAFAVLAVVFF